MSPTDPAPMDMNYWRSLQELADSEAFRVHLEAEFPAEMNVPGDGLSRRRFLQLMSASIAMAGLAGCRWPEEKIVPFASRPEGYNPGEMKRFATTLELAGVASGVLVTSADGRPIKVEGNPEYPFSLGATDVFAQACVLEMYDPDRSRSVVRQAGNQAVEATWDDFAAFAQEHFGGLGRGKRLSVLCEATSSPSVLRMKERLLGKFPAANWYEYEPLPRDADRVSSELAFGKPYRTQIHVDKARVIVDFAADLLRDHPTALRNARHFAQGRNPDQGAMNRLYVFEAGMSVTGAMADHRFAVPSHQIDVALRCLAAELFLKLGLPMPTEADALGWRSNLHPDLDHPQRPEVTSAIARDLFENRGRSLIVVGPAHAHTPLGHILNIALGNVGRTVTYTDDAVGSHGRSAIDSVAAGGLVQLTTAMQAGRVGSLLILGGNPVYNAPADLDFGQALGKVQTSIHLSLFHDETSRACTWHLPRAHVLESWGDARSADGTLCAVQPLIAPLYGGKTAAEFLSLLTDTPEAKSYEIVRETFHRLQGGRGASPTDSPVFENKWRKFLHDGFAAERPQKVVPELKPLGNMGREGEKSTLSPDNLELVFTTDGKLYDGRFANNAWLQELPDALSKLTWDNAALLGPATATELGITDGEIITLNWQGRTFELPVYIQPGQARYTLAVNLGYGRTHAGRVGNGVGFDTYRLRTSDALWGGPGLQITKTGRSYQLASTQDHYAIDTHGFAEREIRVGRLIRETNLAVYEKYPDFAHRLGIHHPPLKSLWNEKDYSSGHKWGMTIDLNSCIGCNACVVACQAENNIPVVGKERVLEGREMHWIRLDRYYRGEPDDPQVSQQPVACVHCEMAPCESVCPVAATLHNEEGLNVMVYNRCVGTRYCANNCPYKVRRFNFFNYQKNLPATQKMVYNPEVTVRSRGVMEKCTYCVQRIETAKIKAKNERRPLQDGEIVPACAQVCPAQAITFGDLNDPHSKVTALQADNRSYMTLAELNVKPRTAYLARIRNPNPELSPHHDQPDFPVADDEQGHEGTGQVGHGQPAEQ